jgi:hypothetical protein
MYYWGCRFDSFLPLLLSVPYYIHTSLALFPCSPCHLSLLACRSLCIIVRALDICVRPPRLPFSAFCTHITLRGRSKRSRRFKRWVWSPCGTHAALTRPTERQRSPPCRTHFFFAMSNLAHCQPKGLDQAKHSPSLSTYSNSEVSQREPAHMHPNVGSDSRN